MASETEVKIRAAVTKALNTSAAFNRKLKNPLRTHMFFTGIHEPMAEELSLDHVKVLGEIPKTLLGTYARIGPNPFKPGPRGRHWFVGDGMVHGIRLSEGSAEWYHNLHIKSGTLERTGEPPAAGGPQRGARNTVNTNVLKLAGKTLALVESGPFPFELDRNLDAVASTNLQRTLTAPLTAHPHEAPKTGEWHAVTYESETQDTVWHVAINRAGEVIAKRPGAVKDGPSIHECSITDDYVIVFDLPVAENALYHHDMETGEKRSSTFDPNLFGGEFVFVLRAADAEESDGWLIGLVIDAKNDTTQLQFFETLDIEQGPIGAVHVPYRIPPGFHGNWIPD